MNWFFPNSISGQILARISKRCSHILSDWENSRHGDGSPETRHRIANSKYQIAKRGGKPPQELLSKPFAICYSVTSLGESPQCVLKKKVAGQTA